MTGKISAVDRRHVFRFEWTKITRVIPIKEVSPEPLQSGHRTNRFFQSLNGRRNAEPAEIPRGKHREDIEAQICRRGPVCEHRLGLLLKIVWRKHMVVRRHEGLKEMPSAARCET